MDLSLISTEAYAITLTASLVFAYGWLGWLRGSNNRLWRQSSRTGVSRERHAVAVVLGLLLFAESYGWTVRIDGRAGREALLAYAITLALAAGATVVMGFAAALVGSVVVTAVPSGPWRAFRHYATGLVAWGLCLGFIAAGLGLAYVVAGLPS